MTEVHVLYRLASLGCIDRLYKLSQSSWYDNIRSAGECGSPVEHQGSMSKYVKDQCSVPDNLSPFYKRTVKTASRQQQPTLQWRPANLQILQPTTYNHTTYNNIHKFTLN